MNICRNSAVSGSCETIQCDGDAIQCAIYRQQAKEYCDNIKETEQSKLGTQMMSGADPLKDSLPSINNSADVDLSLIQMNTQGFLGGGSCVRDRPMTLQGITVTVPFSSICQYIVPLRVVVMLIALLASFRMLTGVILRD